MFKRDITLLRPAAFAYLMKSCPLKINRSAVEEA